MVKDSQSPNVSSSGLPGWLIPAVIIAVAAGGIWFFTRGSPAPVMSYEAVATFPHQSEGAYCQGLLMLKELPGKFVESTGRDGESDWRIVDMKTGAVLHRQGISSSFFGEGISIVGDRLFQLTWRNQKVLEWKIPSLEALAALEADAAGKGPVKKLASSDRPKIIKKHDVSHEGWGMTYDGKRLIVSDGSPEGHIRFYDPEGFKSLGKVVVSEDGKPVTKLNELEWIDGHLYANVFETNVIKKIDIESGEVLASIDLSGLLDEKDRASLKRDEVLNGIAQDPATGKIYVTGKNWPKLFEVKFK